MKYKALDADEAKRNEVQAIKRLADLSSFAYDRVRLQEAENLGIRVAVLDKEVRKISASAANDCDISSPLTDPEPWEDEVLGHELLNDLEAIIRKFSVLPEYAYTVIPLWICFTWCVSAAHTAPILAICSPEKRCGKTTIISILQLLTKRPLSTSNITPAALFRMVEAFTPTLLIDEADTFLSKSDELRGVLNSGHTRSSAYIIRTVGDDHTPQQFNTFGAKAIAMIGKLPDTLEDRSIVIKMRRKLSSEKVYRLHHSCTEDFIILQRKLLRFAGDNLEELRRIRPEALPIKSDRMLDNFELLLAIATLAGPEWLGKSNKALLAVAGAVVDEVSIGASMFKDIREIFLSNSMGRIFSKDLLEALLHDEEKPWATYNHGRPISQKQMATLLSGFDVISKAIRIGHDNLKGYEIEQFDEAFKRYLPSTPNSPVTSSQVSNAATPSVTGEVICDVTFAPSVTPEGAINMSCDDVTDKNINNDDYLFEERAAIMEYDGGLSREEAEEMAREEVAH